MPLQNRVTPEGEIISTPARGTMMGNRGGCFHMPDRTLSRRRWATRQWIACTLAFKGRRRSVMSPGLYTELFFLDEATALSAGHRPCFECRHEDATRFARLWAEISGRKGRATAGEMDLCLHVERLDERRGKPVWEARLAELPTGAFVRHEKRPHLVIDHALSPWSACGYGAAIGIDAAERLAVLTPPTIVAVLLAGYSPILHASARMIAASTIERRTRA